MTTWDYLILTSWWEEVDRTKEYVTKIRYRHVWKPGDEVQEFASGMSKSLGAEGWELVSTATESQSYPTVISPQGNDTWGTFPIYRLFFKRPASSS